MKRYSLFLFFAFLVSLRATAHGVNNGGDAAAIEFEDRAKLLSKKIDDMNELCRGASGLTPGKIAESIDKTRISFTDAPILIGGVQVEAENFPEKMQILVHRGSWKNESSTSRDRLVIHETLGILRISDFEYGASKKVFELLANPLCHQPSFRVVEAGPAQETYLANAPVAVTGKVAFPEANAEFSVTWSALALPAGSQAAFTDGDKLNSSFAPDLPGTYTLELRVNSEKWGTFTSTTQINLREPRPFDCEHEEKVHAPKQGSMAVEAFSAYVPACRGWVYLTHPEKNTVELRNVFTNQQGANYQLSASPLSLVLDPAKHVLYATTASSSLFKIDLDKNEVSEISLEFSAQTVALMGNDLLLATQTDIYQKGAKISAVIDGKSGKTLKTFSDFGKQWFSGYSAAAQKLFLSDDSESWNLTQYSFDRDSLQFTKDVAVSNQSIWNASMVISDNGLHIAGLKTDGAAGFLGISDYSASDIRRMLGAWQNRNTPICGPMAFSHDSKSLFVGCTGSIYRYAADSHQLLSTMDVLPLYLVNGWENMGVSQGNRIVFALSKRYERNPTIYWVLIN